MGEGRAIARPRRWNLDPTAQARADDVRHMAQRLDRVRTQQEHQRPNALGELLREGEHTREPRAFVGTEEGESQSGGSLAQGHGQHDVVGAADATGGDLAQTGLA